MRPVVVVEALEFGQLDVQGADAQLAVVELVELAVVGGAGDARAADLNPDNMRFLCCRLFNFSTCQFAENISI